MEIKAKEMIAPVLAVVTALLIQGTILKWSQEDSLHDSLIVMKTQRESEKAINDSFRFESTRRYETILEMVNANKSGILVLESRKSCQAEPSKNAIKTLSFSPHSSLLFHSFSL